MCENQFISNKKHYDMIKIEQFKNSDNHKLLLKAVKDLNDAKN